MKVYRRVSKILAILPIFWKSGIFWFFAILANFWPFLGLLLVMPGEQIEGDMVYDIAKVAALLHRAADMDQKPSIKETKFLLPKPALSAKDIKPPQWVNMVSKVKD